MSGAKFALSVGLTLIAVIVFGTALRRCDESAERFQRNIEESDRFMFECAKSCGPSREFRLTYGVCKCRVDPGWGAP